MFVIDDPGWFGANLSFDKWDNPRDLKGEHHDEIDDS